MPMSYVCDMDGVIYHGSRLIPGALEFVQRLQSRGHKFLFLTNNSQWTPRDLKHKLEQMGISVDEAAFHTSAPATAEFLGRQKPGGTAYVIGGAGLTHALYSVGFMLTANNPDYVVVGETRSYDYEKIERGPADPQRSKVHRGQPRPDRPHRVGHHTRLRGHGRTY
jgi:NagD protein